MSEHARLSLSWASLWMVCSAWPRMVEGMGDDDGPAIQFGNDSHKLLEDALGSGIAPGDADKAPPEKADMTEADCAQVAFAYAHERWQEMGLDNTTLLPEAKVAITSTGRTDLYGTADVLIYNDGVLEVIDLKTGAGTYVNESTSAQLKLYALAAMETFGLTPDLIRLTIIQPRYWGDEDAIRTLEIEPSALREWLSMAVTRAANATDKLDAPGTVTEGCKMCAGRHVCEYRDREVAHAIGGDGHMTTHNVTEMAIRDTQDLTIYDNERLGQTLLLVPVIRDYCDALEEHAQEIIQSGEQVPGYKVVATAGKSKWVGDTDELLEKLKKSTIKETQYMAYKLKTPKQVAALKTGPNGDKPMSKAIAKIIADHTGRSGGGLALVMDSDPRDSVVPSFAAIPPPIETPAAAPPSPAALPDFLS